MFDVEKTGNDILGMGGVKTFTSTSPINRTTENSKETSSTKNYK